ncbi:hypothetical protein [Streptomyces radicis]|uniref:Uncharacterized protein n=1 Tax=Streptomyces radicis TaxID=1750517 RepID=A0A3A9W4S0_9ACTN|nr:hypothetical protein [Streptomyces radicis]RKN08181.1 hypothetical protein D7319_16850 [Streptomyces radicis]RKN20536.1 hypothetical protein D7318_18710 [Streptomyces radicis]
MTGGQGEEVGTAGESAKWARIEALQERFGELDQQVRDAERTGDAERARASREQALAVLEELCAEDPGDLNTLLELAERLYEHAVVLAGLGLTGGAATAAEHSLGIFDMLVASQPGCEPGPGGGREQAARRVALGDGAPDSPGGGRPAVRAYRLLAGDNADHEPGMARSMWGLHALGEELGRVDVIEEAAAEGLRVYRNCPSQRLDLWDHHCFGGLALYSAEQFYAFLPAALEDGSAAAEDAVREFTTVVRSGGYGQDQLVGALCFSGLFLLAQGDRHAAERRLAEAAALAEALGGVSDLASVNLRMLRDALASVGRTAAAPLATRQRRWFRRRG